MLAGRLEDGESLIDGARREILEETGYDVIINGISLIGNDKYATFIIFNAVALDKIKDYNVEEILNIGWFTYEEIIAMNDKLRYSLFVKNSISQDKNGVIASLDIIKNISGD